MKLKVISSPVEVPDESIIINRLFEAGLECFHVRKPGITVKTIRELISDISPDYYNRISLHQFHEMAKEFGIKRLHFTEQARAGVSVSNLEDQVAGGYTLSTSIHELATLSGLNYFSYTFYGPVFESLSKPGYKSHVDDQFRLNKREDGNLEVIALGGIDVSNLKKAKAMNFDGVAVLGAIWNEPDKAIINFTNLMSNSLFQNG